MAYDIPRRNENHELIDEMLAHLHSQFPDYEPSSQIAKFYANRSIFITGATGFIGKALIEKLVRSCREIKQIYLLIREKRGKNTKERLQDLIQSQIFKRITASRDGTKFLEDKLRVIKGDITMTGFGISPSDMAELSREVSIVFNSAATIRFVEPIDVAVQNNICSITELVNVCDRLSNLQALIHLSTAYSNCHKRDTIYEIFYEPPMRGEQIISAVTSIKQLSRSIHSYPRLPEQERETWDGVSGPASALEQDHPPAEYNRDGCDLQTFYFKDDKGSILSGSSAASDERLKLDPSEILLDEFTQISLRRSNRPNTYAFTKAISESHLLDLVSARKDRYLDSKIPVAIVRPSIVGGAWREPEVGLVDNFNGPTGAILSLYTGALQAMPGKGERVADMVPVDMVVNLVIASAWFMVDEREQSATSESAEPKQVPAAARRRASSAHRQSIKRDHGVYLFNFVSGYRNPLRWHQVTDMIRELAYRYPSKFLVRLPSSYFIRAGRLYNLYDYLNHKLPALLQDFFRTSILRQELTSKTSALFAYGRIRQMTETLTPFTSNQWRLCDSNVCALNERLYPVDRHLFQFDVANINWTDYIKNYIIGSRIYTLKDAPKNVPAAKRHLRMRQQVYSLSSVVVLILLYYFVFRQSALESAVVTAVKDSLVDLIV